MQKRRRRGGAAAWRHGDSKVAGEVLEPVQAASGSRKLGARLGATPLPWENKFSHNLKILSSSAHW